MPISLRLPSPVEAHQHLENPKDAINPPQFSSVDQGDPHYQPPHLSSLPDQYSSDVDTDQDDSESHVSSEDDLDNPENAHDPHQFPSFKALGLGEPLLYLPPLLSSLPVQYSSDADTDHDNPESQLYTETRLPDIDPASLSLHKALHNFRPVTREYAAIPYDQAFNWSQLKLPLHEEREWYCVVFRSLRKSGSDSDSLYAADRLAHEEAIRNGGLILYWYGIPHPDTRMNLATCIWQSRKHAIAANSRPHHINAMKLAANSYDIYSLERFVVRKVHGEEGVTVEPYNGGDVGW